MYFLEEFFQYLQRLEFGEIREVKAIVGVDVVEEATSLGAVESKNVHIFVAHAQEHGDELSFGIRNVVSMRRLVVNEAGRAQVEESVAFGDFDVGSDAQEESEPDEKHKVEVGKIPFANVEPHDGLLNVGKDVGRVGFCAKRMAEKVSKEKSDGVFSRIVGQGRVGCIAARRFWAGESLLGAFVPCYFQ